MNYKERLIEWRTQIEEWIILQETVQFNMLDLEFYNKLLNLHSKINEALK